MHELSIAQSILAELARVKEAGTLSGIARVNLAIGKLSSVNCEALREALAIVTRDTFLENASIVFEEVEPKVRCTGCGEVFEFGRMHCPKCRSCDKEIISGCELAIRSIEGQSPAEVTCED